MWGMCFDWDPKHKDLFGLVVQYDIDATSGMAVICSPLTGYLYEADKLRTLPYDPEHVYGEEACPRNHPDMRGIIAGIRWHGTRQQYFYTLRIAGRLKSKRYFEEDLLILKESNY